MSFESFYGGRMGASFVIVKQFDAIDTSLSGSPQYKSRYLAKTNNGENFLVDVNNKFIEKNQANYLNYNWQLTLCDGSLVGTLPADGSSTTVTQKALPNEDAEGMVQLFEKGGESTDEVNYGEYVIIDTCSKNDPANGQVYRRGMNYIKSSDNPLAGAEYIGQIVGPQGDTPELEFDHYKNIIGEYIKIETPSGDPSAQGWYEYDSESEEYLPTTDTEVVSDKDYYEYQIVGGDYKQKTYTEVSEDLIPGSYVENDTRKFNDNFEFVYSTFKDEYGNIKGCVIGFKLPYAVLDFRAESVSPYDERYRKKDTETGKYYYVDLATEDPEYYDEEKKRWNHPFYEKWHFKIPEGIHGIDNKDFEVVPTQSMPKSFLSDDFPGAQLFYVSECTEEQAVVDEEGNFVYAEDALDIIKETSDVRLADYQYYYDENNKLFSAAVTYNGDGPYWIKVSECFMDILRYKQIDYLDTEEGTITYYNLGYFNDIERIKLSPNGYIKIYYRAKEGENPYEVSQPIRWIRNEEGTDSITLDDDGTVTVYYNTINSSTGENDKDEFEKILTWIKQVSLSSEGNFKVQYNNENGENIDDFTDNSYNTILEWIDWVTVTPEGEVDFWTNTNHEYPTYTSMDRIKYIKNLKINTHSNPSDPTTEGQGNQKLHVTYNTVHIDKTDPDYDPDDPNTWIYLRDEEDLDNPLNYIIESTIFVPSNIYPETETIKYGHLLVYYSDPALRADLAAMHPDRIIKYPSTKYPGTEWSEWYDLGNVKQNAAGIRFIKEVTNLDDLYKDGSARTNPYRPEELMDNTGAFIVGTEGRGWSVGYTHSETDPETGDPYDVTDIYCYDYEEGDWFKIKSPTGGVSNVKNIIDKSVPNSMQKPNIDELNAYGFWFASENAIYAN